MDVLDLKKTNSLLNLISHQPDIDKFCIYTRDPYEAKYQLLINKRKRIGLMHVNYSEYFIDYYSDMDNIYINIIKHNPNKECKRLIVSDDMIADMLSNKTLKPIIIELLVLEVESFFSCFYHTFSFSCAKKHSAKF